MKIVGLINSVKAKLNIRPVIRRSIEKDLDLSSKENFENYKKYEHKLWCDLKSDIERVEFLQCGRAWETGIIAPTIVSEIIDVFIYKIKSTDV